MFHNTIARFTILPPFALFLALGGCGAKEESKSTEWLQGPTDNQVDVDNEQVEIESATLPKTTAAQSQPFQMELDEAKLAELEVQYQTDLAGVTSKSTPSEVTRAFVHTLHRNDLQLAERFLTLKSRAIIHESGLELSPIAGSRAEYVIGEAQYATNDRERAFVSCFVFDPELATPDDPESGKYKVTWALRPDSQYGWRVFGMISEETGQPQMVSFENSQHAQAINQMYHADDALGADRVRQAQDTNGDSIR
ncbi:MAG: hypothetical protein JNL67_05280 [Planctomycetaceae bacterium]|nr:hypothetical protein [Planctomycetaceae bacterium]